MLDRRLPLDYRRGAFDRPFHAVTEWDKVERQGSTRLSNAVINLLLFSISGLTPLEEGYAFTIGCRRGAILP